MPALPNCFPALAAKKAASPEIAALFQVLIGRAQTCAQLEDTLLEEIIRNREARSGKPFQYSKRQQKTLVGFDRDAEQARRDEEILVAGMDDVSLMANALAGEEQQLRLDAQMYLTMPPEVQSRANDVLEFRKETIRIVNEFIESSPLREKVRKLVLSVTPKKYRT